jgi:RIO kinase 2
MDLTRENEGQLSEEGEEDEDASEEDEESEEEMGVKSDEEEFNGELAKQVGQPTLTSNNIEHGPRPLSRSPPKSRSPSPDSLAKMTESLQISEERGTIKGIVASNLSKQRAKLQQ